MALPMQKVGIALIGPSGTGKTTIGKILAKELSMHFHDMDDDGLEWAWWDDGVARILTEKWDDAFLEAEWKFVLSNYGRKDEDKKYTLNGMIFSSSGSLVLEADAMKYIRERMLCLYLDLPDSEISKRAWARGVSRIVGMNGDNPRFRTINEVLEYRRWYYEKFADLTYPLPIGWKPEEDAREIRDFLRKYSSNFFTSSLLSDSRSNEQTSLKQAIITSQPLSGWLWCPTQFPEISPREIEDLEWKSYQDIAKKILGLWSFGLSENEFSDIIKKAYGSQWHHPDITPVKHITENLYSLHLGYGPTFAFKNVALEFLPRLLSQISKGKNIYVLGASSGDTINAAHSGVKNTNIHSFFMLPSIWPSVVQKLQAVSGIRDNPNAFTLLADAPFDPLQDIVKKINGAEYQTFKEKYHITSFNSINIARILAQTVYYFRAYAKLLEMKSVKIWEKVSFSVPSGNFWDALAGYYAMRMWLPVEKINIATNENDMLHVFFETGRYEPPKKWGKDFVEVTNAPSMDIAKSSNFERMLYDIVDHDDSLIKEWYTQLAREWFFEVDKVTLMKIRSIFTSSSSTNTERLDAIRQFAQKYHHGIDPHTAASVVPWIQSAPWEWEENKNQTGYISEIKVPLIFLETSHIAQFTAELETLGISAPGMHEFDDIIASMRENSGEEWKNFLYTGKDFETIFPDIVDIFESRLSSLKNN